tara:strand:- start:1377 stop:1595 length:219 start_codon:yes stop_codon:yes gene_type:complete
MYFSIKAFRQTTTRFENLDSIHELNEFVHERLEMGYNKFIIKSFDEDGSRYKVYYNVDFNGWLHRLSKQPLN